MTTSGILLVDPKFIHNVASAVRAASCFGSSCVTFTGTRAMEQMGTRLPREERMKAYQDVRWWCEPSPRPIEAVRRIMGLPFVPVAVELVPNAETLDDNFHHPENALYVFGPEDGSLRKGIRTACHRFVRIPSFHCMNLSAAAYVVLFHRAMDMQRRSGIPLPELDEPRGEDAWWHSPAIEGLGAAS